MRRRVQNNTLKMQETMQRQKNILGNGIAGAAEHRCR
jgi:hypothetical protein